MSQLRSAAETPCRPRSRPLRSSRTPRAGPCRTATVDTTWRRGRPTRPSPSSRPHRRPGLRGPGRPADGHLPRGRAEHWREVPVPPELLRALEIVHALRSTPAKAACKPLWPWSRATAHRKIARTMADARVEGPNVPERPAAWSWHRGRRRWRAAFDDRGRPGPRQPADHRDLHRRRESRGERFSGSDVGSEGGFGRIRCLRASGEGP